MLLNSENNTPLSSPTKRARTERTTKAGGATVADDDLDLVVEELAEELTAAAAAAQTKGKLNPNLKEALIKKIKKWLT